LRLVVTRMMASFAKWPITSPMTTATCVEDPHERPMKTGPKRVYNHWRSVRAGDRKLRKSEPLGGRGAKKNSIRNLKNGFKNMFHYRTLRCTYIDTNSKTEQHGLCINLLS
jgi:hypothetical protein